MNATKTARLLSLLLAAAMLVSMAVLPAAGEEAPTGEAFGFFNVSGDGGANVVNLTKARSFQAVIPVDMTAEAATDAAADASVELVYNDDVPYTDPALYPHHIQGGVLEGTDSPFVYSKKPIFSNVAVTAETVEDQVCLVVSFDTSVVLTSRANDSAPHSNGGAYLDLCGWYDLSVKAGDTVLGGVENVKIAPYDNFHTMDELYDSMDELVAYANANTDLYVVRQSMGMSQGDNGLASLDMPYLIIAKSKAAVDKWQSIKAEAESDPTGLLAKLESGALSDYQVPILYSNVHANEVSASDGIIEFAWMLVETAASAEKDVTYKKLTGFTEAGETALAQQMGPKGQKYSIAVPDLVADTATYLGFIKGDPHWSGEAKTDLSARDDLGDGTYTWGNTRSRKLDMDVYYTSEDVTVHLPDLLDDVFFLIVPEENVEGRTYITRTSSGGFDLNRDNSFQTQAETINMTRFIAQWNPVSFTEFHGQVRDFQVEPCDPPHEPNFEYDLLAQHLLPGGEAFGIAAVANNDTYNSYATPQRDYLSYTGETNADGSYQTCWYDPWDDMSTSYTPQYAMLHGTVAYTVELPAYSDAGAALVPYGALGQSNYIAQEKQGYLTAQTKILERGVTNANSDAYELVGQWLCDQYDVEGAEAALFRPEYTGEGQNGNFYPECYIIPLTGANQKNLDAADQMLTYLTRNGVKIMTADRAFTYDGVSYPAGTAVVSMYQAKRSVANGALYDGTLITGWPTLYSEGITAFSQTRGFDLVTCAEPAAFATIQATCSEKTTWRVSSDSVSSAYVILQNTSEDAVAAVNTLLKAGKEVSVIIEGDDRGSFLVKKADYQSVSGSYLLTAKALTDTATTKALTKAPVVYIVGKPSDNASGFVKTSLVASYYNYNYDRQAMELMGFTTTDDPAQADIILGASSLSGTALAAVQNGTPYIGYGSSVTSAVNNNLVSVSRATVSGSSMDALAYVWYPTETPVNASYIAQGDELLYGYGAGYYKTIPEGADVLVKIDGSKEPLEGFLCAGDGLTAFLDSSIQAFSYQGADKNGNDVDIVLFANTLTNKVHQRDEFRFISNAAFNAVADEETLTVTAPTTSSTSSSRPSDRAPVADPVEPEPTTPDTPATVDEVKVEKTETATKADGTTVTTTQLSNGSTAVTQVTLDGAVSVDVTDKDGEKIVAIDVPAELPASETKFEDVAEDHWAAAAIGRMAALGLVRGVAQKTYDTDGTVTRGTLATMLFRLSNGKAGKTTAFADVAKDAWYADAIGWASEAGVVTGYSATEFGPNDQLTREQMAVMLLRFAKLIGMDSSVDEAVVASYADANAVSAWAADGMAWCVKNGIINGTGDNTLAPAGSASRAQTALMLDRFIGLIK